MAIDKNSNAFTFGFAIAMVVVVGATLSFAAISLKPRQQANNIEKDMISILSSIGVEATRANASEKFYSNITKRVTLNADGDVVQTRDGKIDPNDKKDPFNVDVKKEYRSTDLKPEDRRYPLYFAQKDGQEVVVVPMVGKGLWGPIWGYVALESDYNTVYGATFDHKTETPGLGAEIKEDFFENPFRGKKIYDESGNLVSIDVKKGGADPGNEHAVDGITGGTITSNGVDEMLERTFGVYDNYFSTTKTNLSQIQ
ncbi:MAG TPA: NADH:ubiquinone reductase (Na(+)-transporting) subunit C [Cryomorphaceae bacterium]|nr:NADH:ubiquinone reductase (Na(+)-transporting) subunit C [Cryomorphaceae bacterium]